MAQVLKMDFFSHFHFILFIRMGKQRLGVPTTEGLASLLEHQGTMVPRIFRGPIHQGIMVPRIFKMAAKGTMVLRIFRGPWYRGFSISKFLESNFDTIFIQVPNSCYQNLGSISLIVWKLCAFWQRSDFSNFQPFFNHNFWLK